MRKLLFVHITAFSILLAACSGGINGLIKKGNKKEAEGHYNDAIELYKQALEKGGNKEKLNNLIGNAYRLTNRAQESVPFYQNALAAGTKEDKTTYYLAQGLKAQGNYADAQINFSKYAQNGSNESLVKLAEKEVENLEKLNSILQKESRYTVSPVGNDINSEGGEFAPLLMGDEFYYTATNNQFKYSATGTGFSDIYYIKLDGSGELSGAKKSLENGINQNKTHEAAQAISPDGNLMVFARSNDGSKKGATDTDLFLSRKKNNEWSAPELLEISDPKSWESSPAFSNDGKTLYFASNRKGGFGGIDLYKASVSSDGKFTNVANLGDKINTAGNEMFPYQSKEGTFFFSSDGQAGLGGLDVFEIKNNVPLNLGTPINSSGDDFGIFFKDTLNGYLASNRPGGKGDDDIYQFKKKPIPIPRNYQYLLNVAVKTSNFKTKTKKPVEKAHIKFSDARGIILKEAYTDMNGMASLIIDSTTNYQVIIDREGFFTYKEKFATAGLPYTLDSISVRDWNKVLRDTMTIAMKKIKLGEEIVLENIYYDYNSSTIRTDAEPDLNLLVDFMKENPHVRVQIGSHTDARGNVKYNQKLSESRAKSAVDYIVTQGVDATRVKAKGYGSSVHIVKNAQTEEEHQKNRRTEFKVIEITK